jgi:hypothetical protein
MIDAGAASRLGASKVDFQFSGVRRTMIDVAEPTAYRSESYWKTTSVPNGNLHDPQPRIRNYWFCKHEPRIVVSVRN